MSERAEFFNEGDEFLAEPYHYVESGLDNIFLLDGVSEAETAYGMSGAEFSFLRKQMGLSQADLATYLGITNQTVANYEKSNPLGPADASMRAIYLLHVVPAETRVEAVESVLSSPKERKKLADVPRRRIVNRWAESDNEPLVA